MILSIVTFVLVLGILVFVHELGHFLVAKWTGMRVDEFALGFPPRVFAIKRGETTYAINALPLGGYVKIYGENGLNEEGDPRAFDRKSVWARTLVLVAGVCMNLVFAFLALCVAYTVGFPAISAEIESIPGAVVTSGQVLVADTVAGSAAARAGVQSGDIVVSFLDPQNGKRTDIQTIDDLQAYTSSRQAAHDLSVQVTLDRDETSVTLPVSLAAAGTPLGVEVVGADSIRLPFYRTPEAAIQVINTVGTSTWYALKDFATSLFHAKLDRDISGPVGIYKATSSAAQDGFASVVFLTVALSINLALLNILPIPVLDGGKLLFVLIEAAFKRRVIAVEVENIITTISFALLILLIGIVTLKDIGVF